MMGTSSAMMVGTRSPLAVVLRVMSCWLTFASATAVLLLATPEIDEPADGRHQRPGQREQPELRQRRYQLGGVDQSISGQLDVHQERIGKQQVCQSLRQGSFGQLHAVHHARGVHPSTPYERHDLPEVI